MARCPANVAATALTPSACTFTWCGFTAWRSAPKAVKTIRVKIKFSTVLVAGGWLCLGSSADGANSSGVRTVASELSTLFPHFLVRWVRWVRWFFDGPPFFPDNTPMTIEKSKLPETRFCPCQSHLLSLLSPINWLDTAQET